MKKQLTGTFLTLLLVSICTRAQSLLPVSTTSTSANANRRGSDTVGEPIRITFPAGKGYVPNLLTLSGKLSETGKQVVTGSLPDSSGIQAPASEKTITFRIPLASRQGEHYGWALRSAKRTNAAWQNVIDVWVNTTHLGVVAFQDTSSNGSGLEVDVLAELARSKNAKVPVFVQNMSAAQRKKLMAKGLRVQTFSTASVEGAGDVSVFEFTTGVENLYYNTVDILGNPIVSRQNTIYLYPDLANGRTLFELPDGPPRSCTQIPNYGWNIVHGPSYALGLTPFNIPDLLLAQCAGFLPSPGNPNPCWRPTMGSWGDSGDCDTEFRAQPANVFATEVGPITMSNPWAPMIVFIHGFGGGVNTWGGVSSALVNKGYDTDLTWVAGDESPVASGNPSREIGGKSIIGHLRILEKTRPVSKQNGFILICHSTGYQWALYAALYAGDDFRLFGVFGLAGVGGGTINADALMAESEGPGTANGATFVKAVNVILGNLGWSGNKLILRFLTTHDCEAFLKSQFKPNAPSRNREQEPIWYVDVAHDAWVYNYTGRDDTIKPLSELQDLDYKGLAPFKWMGNLVYQHHYAFQSTQTVTDSCWNLGIVYPGKCQKVVFIPVYTQPNQASYRGSDLVLNVGTVSEFLPRVDARFKVATVKGYNHTNAHEDNRLVGRPPYSLSINATDTVLLLLQARKENWQWSRVVQALDQLQK